VKLAVGLGNPGDRYLNTRHNVGFRVVEALARASGIERFDQRFGGSYGCNPRCDARARSDRDLPGSTFELGVLLPQTFMNRSGESVAAAVSQLPIDDLASDFVVVLDDMDLPFGRTRIRGGGGAGGHRGLASLIDHLDTNAFPRLRFGVGRPGPEVDPIQYVLDPFSPAEERELGDWIDRAVAALETLFREGVPAAMNQFNRPPERSEPSNALAEQ
jgi:PTH1 family peptidyl-tRNA hydrolase